MSYFFMIIFPIISAAVLFLITRLIGYRQLSQLSLFDYINGITIGSIAAEVAIARGKDIVGPLSALVIFGVITLGIALMTNKSIKMRRKVSGTPIVLISAGKFFDENFTKAHLDLSEFTMQCRNQGYFDVSQIHTAILEPNGIISILPRSQSRPVTPADMNYVLEQEEIFANVIMDGEIMEENLKNIGFDRNWLEKRLEEGRIDMKDIFLAVSSSKGTLNWYLREGKKEKDVLS